MKTIYKYPLQVTDHQKIAMPTDAKILTCQLQNGVLCLWAEVEIVAPELSGVDIRDIEIYGTGRKMDERYNRDYIATVQMFGGSLVWHVPERREMR